MLSRPAETNPLRERLWALHSSSFSSSIAGSRSGENGPRGLMQVHTKRRNLQHRARRDCGGIDAGFAARHAPSRCSSSIETERDTDGETETTESLTQKSGDDGENETGSRRRTGNGRSPARNDKERTCESALAEQIGFERERERPRFDAAVKDIRFQREAQLRKNCAQTTTRTPINCA